ncbi:MAG: response regulator transcription factor [Coriobacteriia bacterium]|nr:response regulator transcription factor [Coriobacteriia bacterium]
MQQSDADAAVVPSAIRVVLADSHEMVRDALCCVLGHAASIGVVGAYSLGQTLVDGLPDSLPDVVIMEAQLPDGAGSSWLPQIRRLAPDAHVIIVAGTRCDGELLLALESGVEGFLFKEDSVESLVAAVSAVMGGQFFASPRAASVMRDLALGGDGLALTSREVEVLLALHDGLTTGEIARKLFLSTSTVKTHIGGIYRKLDVRNRVEATREAERRGIIPPE